MTVPAGELVYDIEGGGCTGSGLKWNEEEFDEAIVDVRAVLSDEQGTAAIEEMLRSVGDTDFDPDGIRDVLDEQDTVEDWRIGEAIAETYLKFHRACSFPWPNTRDLRKSGSSLPGADLVGFHSDEHGDRFAFGEVKTSSDENHPPSVMYGSTGLKKQLEDLRDDISIRNLLMQYLAIRAQNAPWERTFKNAVARYITDCNDVILFGFLVRDVEPHEDDLRSRVETLAEDCPLAMRIEIVALYLPKESINGIGSRFAENAKGSIR